LTAILRQTSSDGDCGMLKPRHAVLGLALLLALLGDSWGQSQEPSPSPEQTVSSPPQPNSAAGGQNTDQEQRETEKAPFIIKILPPTETEQKPNNAAAQKPDKTASNLSLSDWIAAIAALAATLQFVALFWTIYILRRNLIGVD
jgi:hypothetical protein